jgi:hypothetical protein
LRWEVVWECGLLFQYLHLCDHLIVVIEWQFTHQQRVENDSQAPNIDLLACVLFTLQHLRGAVAYRPTPCLQVIALPLILASETKINQLHIAVLIQKYVLELKVAVHAGLVVDVGNGANELGEYALDFGRLKRALCQEVVVELIARAPFKSQPDQLLGDYDFVQARDVRVGELAVVVDLAREVGVVFLRRLEYDLLPSAYLPVVGGYWFGAAHLGAIAELVRGEIDFPEAAFADQLAQRVVADALEICGRKFTVALSMSGPLCSFARAGLLEKLLIRVCELDDCQFARALPPTRTPTTHLLSLCLLFSGGPGIHEKRHWCVETSVLSPSSNTALGLTIGLSRVVVKAAQARPWCVG